MGPVETVGDTLRRTRKERGETLRKIAETLCVRLAYLQALEDGDADRLPGTTYALGFLRSYADHLGLDSFETVERYKMERQGSKTHTELVFPEPVTDGRLPGGAIILISVLLLALVYGGWTYYSSRDTNVSEFVPELPDRLQGLIASDSSPAAEAPMEGAGGPATPSVTPPAKAPEMAAVPESAGEPAAGAASPSMSETAAPASDASADVPPPALAVQDAPEAPTMAPGGSTGDSTGSAMQAGTAAANAPPVLPALRDSAPAADREALPEPPTEPAAEAAVAPDSTADEPLIEETVVIPAPPSAPEVASLPEEAAPRSYGETAAPSRIVLRATQDSWVQVRDAQDALLLTRVLRAGDSYHVPDRPGLTLLTGNAGGIEIVVDGVTLPALGPVGAVRRQVALDPDSLVKTLGAPQ